MIINYRITLPEPDDLPSEAVCFIQIRDTSLMDAPAVILASQQKKPLRPESETVCEGTIKLSGRIKPGPGISFWAHLSMTGKKNIDKNDYITTRIYSVYDSGENEKIVIQLQKVHS